MVEWRMEKYFAEPYADYIFREDKMSDDTEDDFIGVYHPFPKERKNTNDINQLDLFKDYLPPKKTWWRRIIRKKNKKFLGIKLFF